MIAAPVHFAHKLGLSAEPWSPRVVAEAADAPCKPAMVHGELLRHAHADTDAAFVVLHGELRIRCREQGPVLREGEMIVMPRDERTAPIAVWT